MPLYHPPAIANERVQCNAAGQVMLKLKTPWHDGTTQLVMSSLEFIRGRAFPPAIWLHAIEWQLCGSESRYL